MEISTRMSNEGIYQKSYAAAAKAQGGFSAWEESISSMTEKQIYESDLFETKRTAEDCYLEMSTGVNREIASAEAKEQTVPLGMGMVLVGGNRGYGMTAEQVIRADSDDTIVRVKVAQGQGRSETYEVNLSKVNPRNATAIEMFAYCQYADANGKGVNNTFGSWGALKQVAAGENAVLEFDSLEDATNKKMNWESALSKSKTVLKKESTGETVDASDLLKMLEEMMELTAKKDEEDDDWRSMPDEDWDKLLKGVDSKIDKMREAALKRHMESLNISRETASDNYRVVPRTQEPYIDIYDKDGNKLGAFHTDDIKIKADSVSGKEFLISTHGTLAYDALVMTDELKEDLCASLGVDELQKETLQGFRVKTHPETGIQYILRDGDEGRGGKVLIQSEGDRQKFNALADKYLTKYSSLVNDSRAAAIYAELEIRGLAKGTENGIVTMGWDGAAYTDNNDAAFNWAVKYNEAVFRRIDEWLSGHREFMEKLNELSVWEELL